MNIANDLDRARSFFVKFLAQMENIYVAPAAQFVEESFKERPLVTSIMVIFAFLSFSPVLATVGLAFFIICLASAVCFLAVLGLALTLSFILSITLVLSATVSLGIYSVSQRRSWTLHTQTVNATQHDPDPSSVGNPHPRAVLPSAPTTAKRWMRILTFPIRKMGWKSRLLTFLVARHILQRTRLFPRVVRYHPIYRLIFGTPRPRKDFFMTLLTLVFVPFNMVFRAARAVTLTTIAVPIALLRGLFRVVPGGWMKFIVLAVVLLRLSPKLRWATVRLRGMVVSNWFSIVRSFSRLVLAELDGSSAFEDFKKIAYTTLSTLLAFLRALLDKFEDKAEVSSGAHPAEETAEMVSPPVAGDAVSTAVPPLSNTMKARNVTASSEN
ncbi:hypothetical protein C8J57DRAFT_1469338 [Mycena rebaudengoi]|nr:hypothetical protein C8J57DRAFT_1469338 [Mycena rebaudengoi]